MKKLAVLIVALAMVFSLAACGGADAGADSAGSPCRITGKITSN